MDLATFTASLSQTAPPSGLSGPLQALWWEGKGDWTRAHDLLQNETGGAGAWVHAYLHRKEPDPMNAAYWYRRAGKPVATGSFESEWQAIVSDLLTQSG